MSKTVYAISHVKDNPPRRISYYPVDESKEYMMNFCQCVNEGHQKAGTGWSFKVFAIDK